MNARILILLLAGLSAALPFPASAQEEPPADLSDLEGLLGESVVSTASKSAETASLAPATSVSISAEDLKRYGIRSLDEAINFLALGMVTQNPLHSVDIGARGVLLTADFGNHVLLLVNGHTMNEAWGGTAYFERGAAIPFELVDHVEIILGPGSVLYGSNAMLGVINIITKKAKDFRGLHLVGEADLATSGRGSLGYGAEFELLGYSGEVTGQIEYYGQSGPAFTFGPQYYLDDSGAPKQFGTGTPGYWGGKAENSYYTHIPGGYLRARLGRFELDLRAASYKRATPYMNYFNQSFADFNDSRSYELDTWLSLDLKYRQALSEVAELSARLYGDSYVYQQALYSSSAEDCSYGDEPISACLFDTEGRSTWGGLELQSTFDWLRDSSLVTTLGADGRVRRVGESLGALTDLESGTVYPATPEFDRNELALGVYLQQTAKIARLVDLSAGLRFDADERFGTHLSPRAATGFRLWEGGILKLIYAEAFRAPTTFELTYVEPANQIAAPDLKPEIVRGVEAVLEQRWGAQRFIVGGFRSWWMDMVAAETLSAEEALAAQAIDPEASVETIQYRNVSTIHNYGLNAAWLGTQLGGQLRYGVNLTLAKAYRVLPDGASQDLTVAPQLFGNARISYALARPLPVLSLAAAYYGRRPADRAFDGGFDPVPYAPAQTELRGAITGDFPGVQGLSYRLVANYAFASRGPYVAGPSQFATDYQSSAELAPVDRFRAMVGMQYDWL